MDIRFHYYLRTWLNCTLEVIGTILVITSASPLFIVVVIPLGYLCLTVQVSALSFYKDFEMYADEMSKIINATGLNYFLL